MSNTYFLDIRKILDRLVKDSEIMPEERVILLRLMEAYIAKIREELEDELAKGEGA